MANAREKTDKMLLVRRRTHGAVAGTGAGAVLGLCCQVRGGARAASALSTGHLVGEPNLIERGRYRPGSSSIVFSFRRWAWPSKVYRIGPTLEI